MIIGSFKKQTPIDRKPVPFDEMLDAALSDCAWWDVPVAQRLWWAKVDCSGRMTETEYGIVCEAHFNAVPPR